MSSVFIFTRDLRIADNTGLIEALKNDIITPIFILNPEQLKSPYSSNNCIQFMCESLVDLDKSLKKYDSRLFLFYGDPVKILKKLKPTTIYMNVDYTPYARKREKEYKKICEVFSYEDYMLTGVNTVLKKDGNPYSKFTSYYNVAKKFTVRKPETIKKYNFTKSSKKFPNEFSIKNLSKFYKENNDISVRGGRTNALDILKKITEYKNYSKTRNYPSLNTTQLSAYLKFNVISVREAYWAFKKANIDLVRQLYWRDFYMNIIYHFPNVIGNNMKDINIKWDNNKTLIKHWMGGTTGIPIVDAGMRQMNKTGWMHNRLRMIVSCVLVKVFHCDWKIGEKYFAQKLVDYDPANNNGGWQWSASTGVDSQPYFRYLNPWIQAKKFDSNCEYIKKWVEELKDVDNKIILNWDVKYNDDNNKNIYIKPILTDIKKEIKKTMKMFKS
jgi:deoxyribodipyrimidine photo-lyase